MGQRRLTQISERLWDFQLRSLGSFSILFSWGAVEVAVEQLREAIDAANEQMYQTKRTRSGSFNAPGSRKRAVNL
jgi:CO/xanthine dehydrogenase Mo-binding subunit